MRFGDVTLNRDAERIPLSKDQRSHLAKSFDYYGASGVIDKVDKYLFDKPLLLVGEDGANLIARSTPIAFIASGKYWVNNHAHVIDAIEFDLLKYLETFINAIPLTPYITGTAQPKMNQEKMNGIVVALPPLAEQKRIVAKIEKLLPLVEEYDKLEETRLQLDTNLPSVLEKSILQEAIQGKLVPQDPNDEPASELLKRIAAERKALVKAGKLKRDKNESVIFRGSDRLAYETRSDENVCIQDEIPFEIPDSWEWVRLSSLCDFYLGKTPPRGIMEYWDPQEVPWVSIADMIHRGHISTTKECVSNYAMKTGNAGRLSPPETLLMSFKLTIGKVSILDCAASHNEAIISIVPFHDDNFTTRDFLFTFLPILTQYAKSLSAIMGTTLNKKTLGALLVPLPSLAEQKRIVAKIEELRAIIKSLTM